MPGSRSPDQLPSRPWRGRRKVTALSISSAGSVVRGRRGPAGPRRQSHRCDAPTEERPSRLAAHRCTAPSDGTTDPGRAVAATLASMLAPAIMPLKQLPSRSGNWSQIAEDRARCEWRAGSCPGAGGGFFIAAGQSLSRSRVGPPRPLDGMTPASFGWGFRVSWRFGYPPIGIAERVSWDPSPRREVSGWLEQASPEQGGRGPRAWLTAPRAIRVSARGTDLDGGGRRGGLPGGELRRGTGRCTWTSGRCSITWSRLPVFDFHTTLTEYQLAPPGFLVLERMLVRLPGSDVMAARGFPMTCGVASMFLFRAAARRFLLPHAVPIAVGLFALSDWLIYYSSEMKQYSCDLALTLVALLLAAGPASRAATERRMSTAPRPGRRVGRCSWASSARSASGSRIRWRWCSRRSGRT